jgi:hypothetical protein
MLSCAGGRRRRYAKWQVSAIPMQMARMCNSAVGKPGFQVTQVGL